MPILLSNTLQNGSKIAVWHITEEASFFIPKIEFTDFDQNEYDQISHPHKKLEWLASRYLIKILLDKNAIIHLDKKASGKPIITNFEDYISISHSGNYAASICHPTASVSIDIEQLDSRVLRIENKFLSEFEKKFIPEDNKLRYLILCWSAKETVFKYIEQSGVTFKEDIIIYPFELNDAGELKIELKSDSKSTILSVQYRKIDDCYLTFI